MRRVAAAFMAALACTGHALAAELVVLSSDALADLIREQVPIYEKRSGDRVHLEFGPTNALLERIQAGQRADVLLLGREALIDLEKQGRIVVGTPVDIAQVVGSVPKGLDKAVVVTGGVPTMAREVESAKAFLDFLRRPAIVPSLESKGLRSLPVY